MKCYSDETIYFITVTLSSETCSWCLSIAYQISKDFIVEWWGRKFHNIGKAVALASNKAIDCGCTFASR